ncbi:MAG: hypothetical protein ACREMO_01600, partial [Gemmatimonadales bacterium]
MTPILRRAALAVGLLLPLSAAAQTLKAEEEQAKFLAECAQGEGVYVPPGECERVAAQRLAIRQAILAEKAMRDGMSPAEAAQTYGLPTAVDEAAMEAAPDIESPEL